MDTKNRQKMRENLALQAAELYLTCYHPLSAKSGLSLTLRTRKKSIKIDVASTANNQY